MQTFSELPLLPSLQASLKEKGFSKPTEIQSLALPLLLEGKSVIGVAETGSGKTLTYALPILHHLKTLENEKDPITVEGQPRAVVVVPSRELGEQIAKVFKPFTHTTRLRVRTVLGGTTMEVARRSVNGAFEVLVATPGRLLQFTERRLVNLSDVRMFVFDEADQMVDKGFLTDAIRIVSHCPRNRQMALFSATVSPSVQSLMKELFKDATLVRSSGSQKTVETLTTHNCKVINGKREPLLDEVLAMNNKGGTLIFVNTREQCDTLFKLMQAKNQKCAIYRGEMDKLERRRNLKAFREGTIDYLISTDLAGRGLDVEHVGRVINYHLPKGMDNYLHRVGRTARAGREGLVINFVTERDEDLMNNLEESGSGKRRRK